MTPVNGNNSLMSSDPSEIGKITNDLLQDALNISDNESLHSTLILEEGVVIQKDQLRIDPKDYK